jgi:hypothetical protein
MSQNDSPNRKQDQKRRHRAQRKRRTNPFIERIVNQPLDVDTFLFVARVFDAAATGSTPCDMASLRPVSIGSNELRLTDNCFSND